MAIAFGCRSCGGPLGSVEDPDGWEDASLDDWVHRRVSDPRWEEVMVRLDDDMRRVVREQSLGFVATVCPDGTPNLSPKGTTVVWDDEHLVFLHVHSPNTVANLAANPSIEVNVVDPIVRKGYRFKGTAEVLTSGEAHDDVLDYFRRERGTNPERVRAVVLMHVDAAAPVVSPAYDSGASEEEVAQRWRDHHLGLAGGSHFAAEGGSP